MISGDLDTIIALQANGATPRFATFWIVPESSITNGKLPGLTSHINMCRLKGVQPFIQVFIAGDGITEAFFDGTVTTSRGANLGRWWELIKAIGTTLGQTSAIVNIEPEWFKDNITDGAPKFDTAWSDAAYTIRGLAPNTRISNCPGEWCPSERIRLLYPKMVTATDIWATQNLRCLTRDSHIKYMSGPAELMNRLIDYGKAFPGKPLMVTDLCYSTYGGAFSTTKPFLGGLGDGALDEQAAVFSTLVANRTSFESIGVSDIIIRSLRDTNMDDRNYYGVGEDHWGLVRADGSKKPAYASLMAMAKPEPTVASLLAEVARLNSLVGAKDATIAEWRGNVEKRAAEVAALQAKIEAAKAALI